MSSHQLLIKSRTFRSCVFAIQHFLSVATARSCSPVAATFSSPRVSSLTNKARLLPSLTFLHLRFFLRLTQVQLRGSAELHPGLFHFSHFILYLVHGSVFFCIFFPTVSQPHAFFMSLCASGFSRRKPCSSPNPLESSCIHLNSVSQPLSQKVYFFQVRKLFKVQLLYCQKAEAFPPPL